MTTTRRTARSALALPIAAALAVAPAACTPRMAGDMARFATAAVYTAAIVGYAAILIEHDAHYHAEHCGHYRRWHEGRWVYYYGDRWEYYDDGSGTWYAYPDDDY